MDRYRPELAGTPQARAAARFLMVRPPLPLLFRPVYGALATAAVALLPRWVRRELRLPRLPGARTVGRLAVNGIRWSLSAPE